MKRNRAVVVTGAGSGLGQATAQRFLAAGYSVYGFDRGFGADACGSSSGSEPMVRFVPMSVDVTDDAAVEHAVSAATVDHDIVGLIHCAGVAAFGSTNPGHILDADTGFPNDNLATIQQTLHVNLLGSFIVVRHVSAAMAARQSVDEDERGFIVLTSSGAALDGKSGQSAYSASKSGVIGMTLPLARELGTFGIRVVTIAPGLFDTPILEGTPQIPRHIPYPPRMGRPVEFANLTYHIAENPYLNAEVIRIDGGIRGGFVSESPFIH